MRKAASALVLSISFLPSLSRAQTATSPATVPSMQAGGLTPPAPGTGPTPPRPAEPGATQRNLEAADSEDAGRGLEFAWVGAEGGIAYAGLSSLHASGDLIAGSLNGLAPWVGASAGVRLLYLTLGPRFRIERLSNASLWTLNLDLGFRIPLGKLEPYVTLGGGYARLGSITGAPSCRIDGFDVRLGGGLDYYLTNALSIGASVTGDLVRLSRSAVGSTLEPAWQSEASALGLSVNAAGTASLHF
jgi:hypothetical protein